MLEALDLELLQEIITAKNNNFGALKRVVFRLVGDMDPVQPRREILRRMDRLAQRGLLVVSGEMNV